MKIINVNDLLFATVIHHGREVASLRLSGVSNMPELLCRLRQLVSGYAGILTLKLRNYTQGWTQDRAIIMA